MSRREFRATPQAGTKPGFFRRRRRSVESTVFGLWSSGGADRATVNSGGSDSDEDAPVETSIVGKAEHDRARLSWFSCLYHNRDREGLLAIFGQGSIFFVGIVEHLEKDTDDLPRLTNVVFGAVYNTVCPTRHIKKLHLVPVVETP